MSLQRLTGRPQTSPVLPSVLIPPGRTLGGVLVVVKRTPRMFRTMWIGRAEESDARLAVNEFGSCCTCESRMTLPGKRKVV